LVTIAIDGERLFLALPQPRMREISSAQCAELAAALGIPAQRVRARATVDVGVAWMTLQLADAETVLGLRPDQARLAALTPAGTAGVTAFGLYGAGAVPQVEVRSFAPAEGIAEDPVCGSGNGCVAALVRQERLLANSGYVAGQGRCMGRDGRVEVRYAEDGTIWLGGHAVTCVQGVLATGDGT
jgi:PhzF family phenazine biosynthesis protein